MTRKSLTTRSTMPSKLTEAIRSAERVVENLNRVYAKSSRLHGPHARVEVKTNRPHSRPD